MSWLIGRLKCWAGYHEELMCGGHRAQLTALHCVTNGECLSAYCERCGETVGRREPLVLRKPLPQARLVRDSPEG